MRHFVIQPEKISQPIQSYISTRLIDYARKKNYTHCGLHFVFKERVYRTCEMIDFIYEKAFQDTDIKIFRNKSCFSVKDLNAVMNEVLPQCILMKRY